jgi:DNA modification methylase
VGIETSEAVPFSWKVLRGDCVAVMAEMPEASVDAVVCDPPYGLEFMGKDWDRLSTDLEPTGASAGGSGAHARSRVRVTTSGRRQHSTVNRTCATCGGRERGTKRCACETPDWKPMGARRSMPADTPDDVTGGAAPGRLGRRMQDWHEAWAREAFRVLKPGGHLLAFGGTRTSHRLAAGIEDAGFEIRDTIAWMYGSGFPKSLNVGAAIDKAAGAEREVVGRRTDGPSSWLIDQKRQHRAEGGTGIGYADGSGKEYDVTVPATPAAERWDGWGTALKPAHEPIVVARKPLSGTVAGNVLEHGTGALNIDGCRIGTTDELTLHGRAPTQNGWDPRLSGGQEPGRGAGQHLGRWPANVALSHHEDCQPAGTRKVKGHAGYPNGPGGTDNGAAWASHDSKSTMHKRKGAWSGHADADGMETVQAWDCVPDCPVKLLDQQSGKRPVSGSAAAGKPLRDVRHDGTVFASSGLQHGREVMAPNDSGGASRFFYVAKASSAERNAGLDGFEEREVFKGNHADNPVCQTCGGSKIDRGSGECACSAPVWKVNDQGKRNVHPTVKPIELMRWLVRLVTPPGGTVLDPFAGSGTTGCAAVLEGFRFVGIEREPEYADIAEARIKWWAEHPEGVELVERLQAEKDRQAVADAGQGSLFG